MKSFPSQIFVKQELDGEASYLIAEDDALSLASPGDEIPVAVYRLERVGKLVVKAELVDAEGPKTEPAPKKSRAKKEKPVEPLAPEAIEAAPAPTVTQKDVESAIDRLFDVKGIEVTRAAFSRFGVARGRELKPEQYAAFVQKVEDVLAGKEV